MCRFGNQSLLELLGRRPTVLELALFDKALADILDKEFPGQVHEQQQD